MTTIPDCAPEPGSAAHTALASLDDAAGHDSGASVDDVKDELPEDVEFGDDLELILGALVEAGLAWATDTLEPSYGLTESGEAFLDRYDDPLLGEPDGTTTVTDSPPECDFTGCDEPATESFSTMVAVHELETMSAVLVTRVCDEHRDDVAEREVEEVSISGEGADG